MVEEDPQPSGRKSGEDLATNLWGALGKGQVPWWTCLPAAVLVGGIAWGIVAWADGGKDSAVERWFAVGAAVLAFVVGLGAWACDQILFRWGAALRRRRINGDLFSALIFGGVFFAFYAGLVYGEIAPGGFRWVDDWFAVVLVTVFGALFVGSLAAWRGHGWGGTLFAVVALLFMGALGVGGVIFKLRSAQIPGSGTVLALTALWIGGTVLGLLDLLSSRRRRREPTPAAIILAWPVLLIIKAPWVILLLLVVAAWIFGGECLGGRFGHPYIGAFGATGLLVAGVAVALALDFRKDKRKKKGGPGTKPGASTD